ncbi:MAG: type II toxin-antitoxin system HicA family toxin [Clostridiales bacterium]|nr:type II toxin-antitoxin system HicA family toxin [Clostridiales bacterium]
MAKKEKLLEKLFQSKMPKNFTTSELDALMSQCGCCKYSGGRGSSIKYFHEETKRILIFDGPHPGNELNPYQVKKVRTFLIEIGEVEG